MNFKLLFILLLIPFVSAENVGVLIHFPDGSNHIQCISASENANGYELLSKLSLFTLWAGPGPFGHQLCQINGIGDSVSGTGCSYSGKYWRFLKGTKNNWEYMPVGFNGGTSCWNNDINSFDGHYCAKENDLIALSYGKFDDPKPSFKNFDEICNPLKLNEIKIYTDGKKQSDVDEEGGTIEAKPGSKINFKIEIENNYKYDENLKIEDIRVKTKIKDIKNNLDKQTKFKDLETNEDDNAEIEIELPLIIEEDKYDLELKITGKTNYGIKQEIIINYDLEINKEKNDLIFSKLKLDSLESCPKEKNNLFIEIINIGKVDQKDITLSVENKELNIISQDKFNLDEDKENSVYTKNVEFITPNLNPGDYKINLNLDYSDKTYDNIILTIKNCNLLTGDAINENNIEIKKINQASPSNKPIIKQTFLQNYAVPILLLIFLIILIIAIIYISSIL